MKNLIIIRGPSGSGKSTIANYISNKADELKYGKGPNRIMGALYEPPAVFCEADLFFLDSSRSKYKFDSSKLHKAHTWCQANIEKYMFENIQQIIVSNTTTTLKELEVYQNLAKEYNYKVEIWRTPGPWIPEILAERNTHSVPLEVIKRQIDRYVLVPEEQEWDNMEIFK